MNKQNKVLAINFQKTDNLVSFDVLYIHFFLSITLGGSSVCANSHVIIIGKSIVLFFVLVLHFFVL